MILRGSEDYMEFFSIFYLKKNNLNKLCFAVPSPRGNVDVVRRLLESNFICF